MKTRAMIGVEAGESAASLMGVLAGYAAALLAAVIAMAGPLARDPPGIATLLAALLAVIAAVTTLVRVRLPIGVRVALSLALIVMLIASVLRTPAIAPVAAIEAASDAAAPAATVVAENAAGARWATGIRAHLPAERGAPGADASLAIGETVPLDDGRTRLAVRWTLGRGTPQRCGRLAIVARDPQDAAALIAESLAMKARSGRGRC